MATETRKFGWNNAVLQIKAGSTAHDYLGIFQNCRVNIDTTTDNARATRDTVDGTIKGFEYHVMKDRGWTVELGTLIDQDAYADALVALAITGGEFDVYVTRPGGSGGTATYSGKAIFTEANFEWGDGPATQSGTLTGVGPLAPHAAP